MKLAFRKAGSDPLQRSNKPVALAWQRFDVPCLACIVRQDLPQAAHSRIQAGIEIDVDSRRPKLVLEFLPRDQFTRTLEQAFENSPRLLLKTQQRAAFSQFARRGRIS